MQLANQLLAHRERTALKRGHEFEIWRPGAAPAPDRAQEVSLYRRIVRVLYPRKRTDRYIKALKRLQDGLGHLNDVAVAERLVADLLGRPATGKRNEALQRAAGIVLGWHAHRACAVEKKAFKKWNEFIGHKRFWN